MGYMSIATHN